MKVNCVQERGLNLEVFRGVFDCSSAIFTEVVLIIYSVEERRMHQYIARILMG